MAKFSKRTLPKNEQEAILFGFCQALVNFKDVAEVAQFVSDLVSPQELEMLALRLKIAEYLENGLAYADIQKKLQVSPVTIARVQKWLHIGGDGYRAAIKKVQEYSRKTKGESGKELSSYGQLKRRYPMYHWPELLLEEIVRGASKREKERLQSVLAELDKAELKAPLHQKLSSLLRR